MLSLNRGLGGTTRQRLRMFVEYATRGALEAPEPAEELGDGTGNSGGEGVWQLGGKLLASLHVQLRVLQARLLMSSMDTYFRIRCWLLDIRPHSQRDLG